jgi:hypothetical protein
MAATERKIRPLKIMMPIGEAPPPDLELRRRVDALPKGSTIADVLRIITEREDENVREFRTHERKAFEKGESGRLDDVMNVKRG